MLAIMAEKKKAALASIKAIDDLTAEFEALIAKSQPITVWERQRPAQPVLFIDEVTTRPSNIAETVKAKPKRKRKSRSKKLAALAASLEQDDVVDGKINPKAKKTKLSMSDKTKSRQSKREQIAAALAKGPKPYGKIAEETKIPHGSIWDLLQHPWFKKATMPDGAKAYELTDNGRATYVVGTTRLAKLTKSK